MTGDCADIVPAGTRVQVRIRFLEPGERAANLPPDTAGLPYEGRIRGELLQDGRLGESVSIETATGRKVQGVLEVCEPAYTHTFGRPDPALLRAIRRMEELR